MPRRLFVIGPVLRSRIEPDAYAWLNAVYDSIQYVRRWAHEPELEIEFPKVDTHLEIGMPEAFKKAMLESIQRASGVLVVLPYDSTSIGIEAGMAMQLGKSIGVIAKRGKYIPKILQQYQALIDDFAPNDVPQLDSARWKLARLISTVIES